MKITKLWHLTTAFLVKYGIKFRLGDFACGEVNKTNSNN